MTKLEEVRIALAQLTTDDAMLLVAETFPQSALFDAVNTALVEKNNHIEDVETEVATLKKQLRESHDALMIARTNGPDALMIVRTNGPDDGVLPVPRLELVWECQDNDWHEFVVRYRLVYKHFLGETISVPLSYTRVGQHADNTPWRSRYKPGKLELPMRDGCHIMHDAAQFGIPAYAVTPDGVTLLDKTQYATNAVATGAASRRSL